jgi:hypothetical protein
MLEIRKVVTYTETWYREGEKEVAEPVTLAAVAAVMKNPWAEQGYVEDLKAIIYAEAPQLADLLVPKAVGLVGTADNVKAFGKAAVVGVDGELEHASGFIHTLRFGNKFRGLVKGKSFLHFTNKRGGPGSAITIPMIYKNDEGQRSYFLTLDFHIPDAPGSGELVVAVGVSTGGRPHARIGNRYEDMKEMGIKPPR